MAIIFHNVSVGVTVAVARRNDGRVTEHAHLPAMRMARKRQRDALGHYGKDIRLMRKQDHRRIIRYLRQRAAQIVDAAETSGATLGPVDEGDLVAKTGE